jgi:nuclease HARBI1
MSRRHWNTAAERNQFDEFIQFASGAVMYWDADSDDDGDSFFSTSSASSSSSSSSSSEDQTFASSSSSQSSAGELLELAVDEENRIYTAVEDEDLEFEGRLLINDFNEDQCHEKFRFRKRDLQALADALWPRLEPYFTGPKDRLRLPNRYRAPYETCLLLYLYRMQYPHRVHVEMEDLFRMRKSHISVTVLAFSDALHELAQEYFQDPGLWHDRMPYYAHLIHEKIALVDFLWAFLDGTIRKTCRPVYFQEAIYQKYVRGHGLKYQVVKTPDGFIALLFGPWSSKTHDAKLFHLSGLLDKLRSLMPADGSNGRVYALYADSAYPQCAWIMHGFINPTCNSPEALFNTLMSKARIAVEWAFKNVTQLWQFVDFRREMKIFKTAIGQFYVNCCFLTNCHNCFYGSQTSDYFGAERLTLDQSLALIDKDD